MTDSPFTEKVFLQASFKFWSWVRISSVLAIRSLSHYPRYLSISPHLSLKGEFDISSHNQNPALHPHFWNFPSTCLIPTPCLLGSNPSNSTSNFCLLGKMSYHYGIDMPFGASITSPVLDQAQTRLHQTEQTYSRTQQELVRMITSRKTTPMSAVETSIKDQEIAALQLQLKRTEVEMNNLKETIRRQQVTIKTQSEAISNPKQHYVTPHRRGNNQPFGTFHGQPPSQPMQPPPPPPWKVP